MSWIKLHRTLKDWEWYDDINATRLLVHLLVSVNYEPKKWKGILIPAGSMVFSWDSLSDQIGLSVKQCRIAMEKLESSGEAARKGAGKGQLVTLTKWEKLQNNECEGAANRATKGHEKGRMRATTKEYKESKEGEEERTYTFNFRKSLVEAGANEILASDWLKVRTRKKAANTETALKGFLKQVEKSGLSINEVLTECIERSWSGFKSEWIEKEKSPAKKEKELTPLEQLRALNKALDNGQITFSDE